MIVAGTDCQSPTATARLKARLRTGLRVAAFSLVFGLLLSILDPTLVGVFENLVYSLCIGLSIYGVISLIGLFFAPRAGAHPFTSYLARGLVAVPVGLFVGLNIAAFLRGNPVGFAVLNHAAFFAFPFTIVGSTLIMYVLWSRKRLADVATVQAETQRQMAEAKLKLLQAQIEPHMLFNTLANLRTLIDVDPLRAQTMIDQLIVYLRGTLSASRSTSTTLEAEFAQLAAYLELMQVRMAARLTFTLDLPDALRASTVPPMLLQPLVENAIRHGLEPKIEGGSVQVFASSSSGRLQIEVRDDGIGLAGDAAGAGYGLEHVRERLRTLYGDAAALTIAARPEGGVRARVELPR